MADSDYVDTDALPWRDTPYEGVRFKKLAFDRDRGLSTVLLEFAPGARYGTHRHPEGEQYLVLSGSLTDGGHTWGAGTYVRHEPGSVHTPRSDEGCRLFVTLPKPIELL
jgi:anti-sigma factor ChrR (cupin superfamily)